MHNANIVHSITFSTSKLKDSSSPGYIEFKSKYVQCSSASEKIVADFNNDGHLDIFSVGGENNCNTDTSNRNLPLEINLYDSGDYIYQDTNIPYGSKHVNVVDIDNDNDLDVVMTNGKIAVNDGQARFTTATYEAINPQLDYFFSFDWNQDGFIDIITQDNIYLNDGSLNFSKIENNQVTGEDNFAIVDLDTDDVPDLLVHTNSQLQSWINNGQGQLELLSSLEMGGNSSKIKAIDLNADGSDEFILSFNDSDNASLKLIDNDGQGNLSFNDFEFSQLGSIEHTSINIIKIYAQDADNDGDEDVWISATFTSDDIYCINNHNIFLIYENTNDGQLSYKQSLHLIGFEQQESVFPFFTPTDQSFPTIIDLNQDNLPDVIMLGDKNVTWLQVSPYVFELSNSSSLQFNNHIQAVDFNKDGNVDILSSGIYSEGDSRCTRQFTDYPDDITSTITSEVHGKLWMGDGNGEFNPLSSENSTGFIFNTPYKFAKLVDLNQDGDFEIFYQLATTETVVPQYYYQESSAHSPQLITSKHRVIKQFEFSDLDNDGIQEIILLSFVDPEFVAISILKKMDSYFEETDVIILAHIDSFKLEDMDSDGNVDMIFNLPIVLYTEINSLSVLYNNGDGTFQDWDSFADDVWNFSVSDINGDGLLDILYTDLSEIQIMLNQGQRNFVQSDYDNDFWPSESGEYIVDAFFRPEEFKFRDMNNDEKEDLLTYDQEGQIQIFINNSTENDISFYKIYNVLGAGPHSYRKSNIAIADFNNDGLLDFANGNQESIKINTQKAIEVPTGLHFDNDRVGHGFSIEDVGRDNLFYSLFYSYDDEGKPEWYSALSRYRANDEFWSLGNVEYNPSLFSTYDYETNTATLEDTVGDYSRIIFFNYKNETNLNVVFDVDDNQNVWSLKELISSELSSVNDLSGIWWAGAEDSGWGMSLSFLQTGNTQSIVAILYFYDENGQPRWLIGQAADFELNQDITVNMKQVNGYGRNQNFVELTQIPAGTLTLNLKTASKDFNKAGSMSMDVFYPEDQSNNSYWVRDNIPLALFSKPRD